MNSGKVHSLDMPSEYATIANVQHEPTTHNAITRASGSLAMYAPSSSAVSRESAHSHCRPADHRPAARIKPHHHRFVKRVGRGRTFIAISIVIFFKMASEKVLKFLVAIMNAPGPPITLFL
jgi:hypothetical protein